MCTRACTHGISATVERRQTCAGQTTESQGHTSPTNHATAGVFGFATRSVARIEQGELLVQSRPVTRVHCGAWVIGRKAHVSAAQAEVEWLSATHTGNTGSIYACRHRYGSSISPHAQKKQRSRTCGTPRSRLMRRWHQDTLPKLQPHQRRSQRSSRQIVSSFRAAAAVAELLEEPS